MITYTSCKPCHQVYQGNVQCFSALQKDSNERKFYSFQSRPWRCWCILRSINVFVIPNLLRSIHEKLCVIPNLCIFRFVSLLPFFFFDQSHTDFSCNINFKSNNNNSERETTLITKSQIDWNQDLSQPSVDLSAATFATAAVSSSVVRAFLIVRDFLAPQVI